MYEMPPTVELADGTVADVGDAKIWQQSPETWYSFAPGVPPRDPEQFERLAHTKAGLYVLVTFKAHGPSEIVKAEKLEPQQAARWLLLNNHAVPDELEPHAKKIRG